MKKLSPPLPSRSKMQTAYLTQARFFIVLKPSYQSDLITPDCAVHCFINGGTVSNVCAGVFRYWCCSCGLTCNSSCKSCCSEAQQCTDGSGGIIGKLHTYNTSILNVLDLFVTVTISVAMRVCNLYNCQGCYYYIKFYYMHLV